MRRAAIHILTALALASASPPAMAEGRLVLSFLPPDLPPSDICNTPAERFEDEEIQIADAEVPAPDILIDADRIEFLARDIRNFRRSDPEGAFTFVMALISRLAELDPEYAGIAETFDRIELFLAAGRLAELAQTGLIEDLTARLEELGRTDTVRLAGYYLKGLGVARDRDFGMGLLLEQAYLGNANALMDILRMQLRGEEVDDWMLSPEETARLAFGGVIGRMNQGLCARAERLAREYTDGDILAPNADLALAWRRFAADMGGGEAAWRVVEHYLSVPAGDQDTEALEHYLRLAVANGAVILPETVEEIATSGATTEAGVRRILGDDAARSGMAGRASATQYLSLEVRLTGSGIAEDGAYFQYLKEISTFPGVPAPVLTRLARETLLRKGQWAGQDEAEPYLRRAADMGDPDALRLLARLAMSDRDRLGEAEALLLEAVEVAGEPAAMEDLDTFYRCKARGAPRLDAAEHWAALYRSTGAEPVTISHTDLSRLDPRSEPEALARMQGLAVRGHGGSMADWLQYLQSDRSVTDTALRHWAGRVSQSDMALEEFVLGEFELALTSGARESAVELFRRAYLDIGPAISLDLAVALVEHGGRDPAVSDQIASLLHGSATRGEGAAIRLLQRLTRRDPREVYRDYAGAIETRGDFLAHIFAAPFVSDVTFRRYMDRAVSLMSCSTKDIAELTDAHALRGDDAGVLYWTRMGLAVSGGNSLTKLGLTDSQIASFGQGASIAEDISDENSSSVYDLDGARRSYAGASDPDSAAGHLAVLFNSDDRDAYLWALERYRQADAALRRAVDARVDIWPGLEQAAEAGDARAQFELGMLQRATAKSLEELKVSTEWLSRAAQAGNGRAMVEYARAIGFGIGREPDPKHALIWLDRAEAFDQGDARALRDLMSAMVRR